MRQKHHITPHIIQTETETHLPSDYLRFAYPYFLKHRTSLCPPSHAIVFTKKKRTDSKFSVRFSQSKKQRRASNKTSTSDSHSCYFYSLHNAVSDVKTLISRRAIPQTQASLNSSEKVRCVSQKGRQKQNALKIDRQDRSHISVFISDILHALSERQRRNAQLFQT